MRHHNRRSHGRRSRRSARDRSGSSSSSGSARSGSGPSGTSKRQQGRHSNSQSRTGAGIQEAPTGSSQVPASVAVSAVPAAADGSMVQPWDGKLSCAAAWSNVVSYNGGEVLAVSCNVLVKFDKPSLAVASPGGPLVQPEMGNPVAVPSGMLFCNTHFCSVSPLGMHVSSDLMEKI